MITFDIHHSDSFLTYEEMIDYNDFADCWFQVYNKEMCEHGKVDYIFKTNKRLVCTLFGTNLRSVLDKCGEHTEWDYCYYKPASMTVVLESD